MGMGTKSGGTVDRLASLVAAHEAERAGVVEPEPVPGAHDRFLVVLLEPDIAERLGFDRDEAGLKLFSDHRYDSPLDSLAVAVEVVTGECGYPVRLVEEHTELWCWRFAPAGDGDAGDGDGRG